MDRRAALALCLSLPVASCGLRPLYGTGPEAGGVKRELAAVAVPEPQTRVGQLLRNELISQMRPPGQEEQDRYTLLLVPSVANENSINNASTDTLRYRLTLTVSYTLSEIGTGKALTAGKTFSIVSYDETGQSFADGQAKRDAAERAAKEAAQDIFGRIAGYFAARK